jgi:tetratricopeptide (TPR) repeat protein
MTSHGRAILVALGCACLALIGGVGWLISVAGVRDGLNARRPVSTVQRQGDRIDGFDEHALEDSGWELASEFTAPIHDQGSLEELREAVATRGDLALAVLQAESDQTQLRFRAPKQEVAAAARLFYQIGLLNLYEGRYSEASAALQKARELGRPGDIAARDRAAMTALLGIVALRRGEVENGLKNPGLPSTEFPITLHAIHTSQSGSREAIKWFSLYLNEWPDDLRVRWLLNIAFMRLGEYPAGVPVAHRITLDRFQSRADACRFENVAEQAGLNVRGPNQAGGSVFDDFNGDALPDLFIASLDTDRGPSLFINGGDGTFEDRSDGAGLADQVYASNVVHADFDNDGDLDVVLLRGAGERPMRLSLLANDGDGRFKDVTLAARLGEPIAAGAAAWGDYDNDGWVDLFVCGEYRTRTFDREAAEPDPRNRCRLYRNEGSGTFRDVAAAAGVVNERCARGAAWGDYDDDGRLDLYVANENGGGRLYHNEGAARFRDVASSLDVTGPRSGHSCWFWDLDNDGWLDLFVAESQTGFAQTVAFAAGFPAEPVSHPFVYRNLGNGGFREISRDVGLARPIPVLGANFGDFDNDGFLDLYAGTGWRGCSGLFPNTMFRNIEGRRFEDVTMSTHTGQLEQGQGISFADFDDDGDLDLFVEAGGLVPGDRSRNLLFRNTGHDRHWLKVRLIGTRTNRAGLGARIRVAVESKDGRRRSIVRTVGSSSSSGGNSLVQLIGLSDSRRVAELQVRWPTSGKTQIFRDLVADQAIQLTEFDDQFRILPRKPVPQP